MRKAEQRVWDSMKRNMPSDFWLRRIENEVGVGEADVWVGTENKQTWCELKSAILPKRAATQVMGRNGLNPAQINWHLKMASLNLPTFVLIRDNALQLYLLPGKLADKMNAYAQVDLAVHSVADSWEEIAKRFKSC